MVWNWQHSNWPHFIYDEALFEEFELKFIEQAGVQAGSIKHISEEDNKALKIELLSNEAYKTSEIEGELLDRESLQSSVQRQFGLKTDNRKVNPAEQGISEMMVDLYQNFATPLTNKVLFSWHSMLMNGRRDLEKIGAYRTHEDPMQIISGSIHKPKIRFEAPPSKLVHKQMKSFLEWYNKSMKELPSLIHSGIAHLYFESIHPFEDGNGRIGRAISEIILSQRLERPTLIALSEAVHKKKKEYYQYLHDASKTLEINEWLKFFSQTILEAQIRTQSKIDFLIEKGKFFKAHADQLNDRQEKVVQRIFKEGVDGFQGGLSADNYISITSTSRATATRDLQYLVESGAFNKTGTRRYTRYYLNIDHEAVKPLGD